MNVVIRLEFAGVALGRYIDEGSCDTTKKVREDRAGAGEGRTHVTAAPL